MIIKYILNRSFFLVLFTICAFIIISLTNAKAAIYYVDALKGRDDNSGTFNSPWATIEKANKVLKAGDTAYLREGNYNNQQIRPTYSGEPGKFITYKNYDKEKVILSSARIPIYLDKKQYIQIDGLEVSDCIHFFVFYNSSNYNIIKNCIFYKASAYFGSLFAKYFINPTTAERNKNISSYSNNYNKILNNTWLDAPDKCPDGPDQDCQTAPADAFVIETGSYNIIEGNSFGKVSHTGLTIRRQESKNNIIRGNVFRNTYRRGLSMNSGTTYNLIEKNLFYDHGLEMAKNPTKHSRNHPSWNPTAIQSRESCNNLIIRRNIFDNNGHILTHSGENMHFYQNTANKQLITIYSEGGNDDFRFNKFKNNIFSNTSSMGWPNDNQYVYSWLTYVQKGHVMANNIITNNIFTGNNRKWRYNSKKTFSSLKEFENSSDDIYDNKMQNPLFVNAKEKDFRQAHNSVSIDSGVWLTKIMSPTEKTRQSFFVEDAGYFFDGWGIPLENGDYIKTENGNTTQINKIDYEQNIVYVYPAIDIFQNEGLALIYSGNRPDIGAFEQDSTYNLNSSLNAKIYSPKNLRIKSEL